MKQGASFLFTSGWLCCRVQKPSVRSRLASRAAVSYTHLDVYKRQDSDSPLQQRESDDTFFRRQQSGHAYVCETATE